MVGANGQTRTGSGSRYPGVLSIGPGTYTLTQVFTLSKALNDGYGTLKAGSYTTTCTFTVQ